MDKQFIFFNTHRRGNKMATDKLFKVAGISKLNGEYKVRFANDIMRIKVLAKSGHEDIRLAELDTAMSKLEAALAIQGMEDFSDVIAQATIGEYLDEKSPKAKVSKPVATKATKTPVAKTTKVVENEDAPF